jgi:hypothetical protein
MIFDGAYPDFLLRGALLFVIHTEEEGSAVLSTSI